jgi:hypothetical protein
LIVWIRLTPGAACGLNPSFMTRRSLAQAFAIVAIALFLTLLFTNKHKVNQRTADDETTAAGEALPEPEENGADKQLDNWFQQKGYPNPGNLSAKYQHAWEEYVHLKENAAPGQANRALNTAAWVPVGPQVFGGRVLSLAINRLVNTGGSRTLFAGSASGGIWKSYSGGVGAAAWQPVVTNTQVLGVSSIVYHPTDTSILLAGTGEVYRVDTVVNGANSANQTGNNGRVVWKTRGTYGIGILRSTNAGNTWTQVLTSTMPNLFGIQKIKFDPTNVNIVYACATDGLYKSTNAGAGFTKIIDSKRQS